jgi:CheY-like chemotaxis protein
MSMTGALGTRSLLVIEDDPDSSNLLDLYFTSKGYAVAVANRGADGLAHARQHPPDLILLDINLPDLDGFTVCRELRTSARTSHVPIIFLTERSAQSDRVAGLGAGAQDYLVKPFDVEELRLRIQNLIARTERENLVDPRTRLPTGRLIDDQLQRWRGQPGWRALECKIESFRPFVDLNGFVAGDDVLKFTAHLLRETLDAAHLPDDFIGHPANETFLIVTAAADLPPLMAQLKSRFDAEVLTHYGFMDKEQGYVLIRDKNGQPTQAPLMSLTVTERAV